MARENRLKKKQYVTTLEESLSAARKENENLEVRLKERDTTILGLLEEVVYYKQSLANVKEISQLINAVRGSGMHVTTFSAVS